MTFKNILENFPPLNALSILKFWFSFSLAHRSWQPTTLIKILLYLELYWASSCILFLLRDIFCQILPIPSLQTQTCRRWMSTIVPGLGRKDLERFNVVLFKVKNDYGAINWRSSFKNQYKITQLEITSVYLKLFFSLFVLKISSDEILFFTFCFHLFSSEFCLSYFGN